MTTRSTRLRATGWAVLVAGVAAAVTLYWVNTRTNDPVLDDVNALGYTRSLQHGMDVMMGSSGRILTQWAEDLASPAGESVLVLMCAALLAGYFFRVAWVSDEEERENR